MKTAMFVPQYTVTMDPILIGSTHRAKLKAEDFAAALRALLKGYKLQSTVNVDEWR